MKIKIIDLLNMIAKGEEVPKKIRYLGYEYCLLDSNSYISNDRTRFFDTIMFKELNNEVIVIEDKPKEIERVDREFDNDGYLSKKLNEIIDKVNEMSKDD